MSSKKGILYGRTSWSEETEDGEVYEKDKEGSFNYNKYEVDIYNDRFPITILGIQKYMTMTCDIYIDKIWKFNGKYICKWKVKKIEII